MPTKHSLTLMGAMAFILACGSAEDSGSARADSADSVATSPQTAASAPRQADTAIFPPGADFLIHDYKGAQVDLRDYAGKVVILNFWATWCPPCRYEVPFLVQLRSDFDPADVAILGVAIDHGSESQVAPLLARFVHSLGINYPVLMDPNLRLLRQYVHRDLSTVGVPMTFVLDRHGVLFSTHEGLPHDANGKPDPRGVLGREIRSLLGAR